MEKFSQFFNKRTDQRLQRLARKRGITLQSLLRAVVIPEWLEDYQAEQARRARASNHGAKAESR